MFYRRKEQQLGEVEVIIVTFNSDGKVTKTVLPGYTVDHPIGVLEKLSQALRGGRSPATR